MAVHELPLERSSLHGHFSPDLPPALRSTRATRSRSSCRTRGGGSARPPTTRRRASISSLATRSSTPATRCAGRSRCAAHGPGHAGVHLDELRARTWGVTDAGGWSTPLNERLGVADGETRTLVWRLDPRRARDATSSAVSVDLRAVPRRDRDAAAGAGRPLDVPAAALGREHRLLRARPGRDALPADSGRRALCSRPATATRGRATARCRRLAIEAPMERAR